LDITYGMSEAKYKVQTLKRQLVPAPLRRSDTESDYVKVEAVKQVQGESEVDSKKILAAGGMKGEGKRSGKMSLPPPLVLFPKRTLKMQFNCGSSTPTSVTAGALIAVWGNICTVTNSTMVAMHSAMRLRYVKIWAAPASASTEVIDVYWTGGSGNVPDQETARAVPTGVSVSGALTFTPPKGSLAAFWWDSVDNATQLFAITCSGGSIVELCCDVSQQVALSILSTTIATGTLGGVYYGYLDGVGSHRYQPIAVTSTF